MKHLIIIFSFFCLLSCNGQDKKNENQHIKNDKKMNALKDAPYNITDIGDGVKFNYDTLSPQYILLAQKTLKDNGFKFPTEQDFESKIKDVFDFDIKLYDDKIIVLKPSMFPDIAIKEKNFILIEDPEYDDSKNINSELLLYYNNYIFYNDKLSFNILKLKYPTLIKNLVISYGYNKDKELVKFTLQKFDFDNEVSLHDLLFSYNIAVGKYYIRKGILDDIENIMFGGATEDFSYAKEGNAYNRISNIITKINQEKSNYIEPDKTIAYLYEKQLRIGVTGNIEEKLNEDMQYKTFLEKNSYYGFERLKDYVKYIYQKNQDDDTYTIQDPDGYTNLRKDKNTSSEVIKKIKSGEHIEVIDNSGDWLLIKTQEGKQGYVHKSRVKEQ